MSSKYRIPNRDLELLTDITGDPAYVARIKGEIAAAPVRAPLFVRPDPCIITPATGMSRKWNDSFTNIKIPQYDAINDRYCKFRTGKKKRGRTDMRFIPHWRADGAINAISFMNNLSGLMKGKVGELSPLQGAVSFVGDTSLQPFGDKGGVTGGMRGRPVEDRGGLSHEQQEHPLGEKESLESLYQKSRDRLLSLWHELQVPEVERLPFTDVMSLLPDHPHTADDIRVITEEIQRLIDISRAAVEVEKAIELREGFLYLLQEFFERFGKQDYMSGADYEAARKDVDALCDPFRNASLQVVEAIQRWKDLHHSGAFSSSGAPPEPYMWKDVSYLHKMNTDTLFLVHSKAEDLLPFAVSHNPLLDPRRLKSEDGILPPLVNASLSKNQKQRLPNLPYARITRAAEILTEEARRQIAMGEYPSLATEDERKREGTHQQQQGGTTAHLMEQASWNAHRMRPSQDGRAALVRGTLAWAATTIQRTVRGYLGRKVYGVIKNKDTAASTIQHCMRHRLTVNKVERVRRQMKAVKKIQALARGIVARNAVTKMKRTDMAANDIQRLYRGHLARRYTDMLKHISNCATVIQSLWRGRATRRQVHGEVNWVRSMAARRIQACWRGYFVRKSYRLNPFLLGKIVKLQAWTRGCLNKEHIRRSVIERYSAIRIQSWWRTQMALMQAKELRHLLLGGSGRQLVLDTATKAVLTIQSSWRMHKAKVLMSKLRKGHQERLKKQRDARQLIERKRECERQIYLGRKASRIQALARGWLTRNAVRKLRALHLAATAIQQIARGRLGRKRSIEQRVMLVKYMEECSGIKHGREDVDASIVDFARHYLRDRPQIFRRIVGSKKKQQQEEGIETAAAEVVKKMTQVEVDKSAMDSKMAFRGERVVLGEFERSQEGGLAAKREQKIMDDQQCGVLGAIIGEIKWTQEDGKKNVLEKVTTVLSKDMPECAEKCEKIIEHKAKKHLDDQYTKINGVPISVPQSTNEPSEISIVSTFPPFEVKRSETQESKVTPITLVENYDETVLTTIPSTTNYEKSAHEVTGPESTSSFMEDKNKSLVNLPYLGFDRAVCIIQKNVRRMLAIIASENNRRQIRENQLYMMEDAQGGEMSMQVLCYAGRVIQKSYFPLVSTFVKLRDRSRNARELEEASMSVEEAYSSHIISRNISPRIIIAVRQMRRERSERHGERQAIAQEKDYAERLLKTNLLSRITSRRLREEKRSAEKMLYLSAVKQSSSYHAQVSMMPSSSLSTSSNDQGERDIGKSTAIIKVKTVAVSFSSTDERSLSSVSTPKKVSPRDYNAPMSTSSSLNRRVDEEHNMKKIVEEIITCVNKTEKAIYDNEEYTSGSSSGPPLSNAEALVMSVGPSAVDGDGFRDVTPKEMSVERHKISLEVLSQSEKGASDQRVTELQNKAIVKIQGAFRCKQAKELLGRKRKGMMVYREILKTAMNESPDSSNTGSNSSNSTPQRGV